MRDTVHFFMLMRTKNCYVLYPFSFLHKQSKKILVYIFVKIIFTIHAPVDPQVRVRAVRTVGTVALAEHDPVRPPHYAPPPSVAGGRGMTSATVAVSQFAAFVAAAKAFEFQDNTAFIGRI